MTRMTLRLEHVWASIKTVHNWNHDVIFDRCGQSPGGMALPDIGEEPFRSTVVFRVGSSAGGWCGIRTDWNVKPHIQSGWPLQNHCSYHFSQLQTRQVGTMGIGTAVALKARRYGWWKKIFAEVIGLLLRDQLLTIKPGIITLEGQSLKGKLLRWCRIFSNFMNYSFFLRKDWLFLWSLPMVWRPIVNQRHPSLGDEGEHLR